MRLHLRHHRPRGAAAIEFAFAGPIALFLVLATIVGALGTFRYQQVASLAREGARWASVHGADYAKETNNPAATPTDVWNKAVLPSAVSLDTTKLTCNVTWNSSNEPLTVHQDVETPIGNTVTVTVTYVWFPERYLVGPITMTSTSTAQMIY